MAQLVKIAVLSVLLHGLVLPMPVFAKGGGINSYDSAKESEVTSTIVPPDPYGRAQPSKTSTKVPSTSEQVPRVLYLDLSGVEELDTCEKDAPVASAEFDGDRSYFLSLDGCSPLSLESAALLSSFSYAQGDAVLVRLDGAWNKSGMEIFAQAFDEELALMMGEEKLATLKELLLVFGLGVGLGFVASTGGIGALIVGGLAVVGLGVLMVHYTSFLIRQDWVGLGQQMAHDLLLLPTMLMGGVAGRGAYRALMRIPKMRSLLTTLRVYQHQKLHPKFGKEVEAILDQASEGAKKTQAEKEAMIRSLWESVRRGDGDEFGPGGPKRTPRGNQPKSSRGNTAVLPRTEPPKTELVRKSGTAKWQPNPKELSGSQTQALRNPTDPVPGVGSQGAVPQASGRLEVLPRLGQEMPGLATTVTDMPMALAEPNGSQVLGTFVEVGDPVPRSKPLPVGFAGKSSEGFAEWFRELEDADVTTARASKALQGRKERGSPRNESSSSDGPSLPFPSNGWNHSQDDEYFESGKYVVNSRGDYLDITVAFDHTQRAIGRLPISILLPNPYTDKLEQVQIERRQSASVLLHDMDGSVKELRLTLDDGTRIALPKETWLLITNILQTNQEILIWPESDSDHPSPSARIILIQGNAAEDLRLETFRALDEEQAQTDQDPTSLAEEIVAKLRETINEMEQILDQLPERILDRIELLGLRTPEELNDLFKDMFLNRGKSPTEAFEGFFLEASAERETFLSARDDLLEEWPEYQGHIYVIESLYGSITGHLVEDLGWEDPVSEGTKQSILDALETSIHRLETAHFYISEDGPAFNSDFSEELEDMGLEDPYVLRQRLNSILNFPKTSLEQRLDLMVTFLEKQLSLFQAAFERARIEYPSIVGDLRNIQSSYSDLLSQANSTRNEFSSHPETKRETPIEISGGFVSQSLESLMDDVEKNRKEGPSQSDEVSNRQEADSSQNTEPWADKQDMVNHLITTMQGVESPTATNDVSQYVPSEETQQIQLAREIGKAIRNLLVTYNSLSPATRDLLPPSFFEEVRTLRLLEEPLLSWQKTDPLGQARKRATEHYSTLKEFHELFQSSGFQEKLPQDEVVAAPQRQDLGRVIRELEKVLKAMSKKIRPYVEPVPEEQVPEVIEKALMKIGVILEYSGRNLGSKVDHFRERLDIHITHFLNRMLKETNPKQQEWIRSELGKEIDELDAMKDWAEDRIAPTEQDGDTPFEMLRKDIHELTNFIRGLVQTKYKPSDES